MRNSSEYIQLYNEANHRTNFTELCSRGREREMDGRIVDSLVPIFGILCDDNLKTLNAVGSQDNERI